MKKLILLLVGGVTLAGFSACARNFHNGNISQDESFKLMGFQDSGTPNFDKMHGRMESFMKDLNLTDAQKETFKEIKNAVKENFEKNKDKRIALRESLKKEFLSDSINKENLKSSIDTMKSEHEAKVDMMANNIIKIYKTLTPEQRTKIENKMKFIEDKVSMFADKPFFKNFHNGSEKRLAFLKSNLHLSEDQVNSLKGLFEGNKDQKSEMFKNFKSIKDSVQTELKTGNPDVEKIKGILNDGRKIMESKMDSHLDKIVKVHDVLNPEQRQKLVTLLETKHKSMFDKMKSHF
jgi:Spy/CpxP family protein refolding chaperone